MPWARWALCVGRGPRTPTVGFWHVNTEILGSRQGASGPFLKESPPSSCPTPHRGSCCAVSTPGRGPAALRLTPVLQAQLLLGRPGLVLQPRLPADPLHHAVRLPGAPRQPVRQPPGAQLRAALGLRPRLFPGHGRLPLRQVHQGERPSGRARGWGCAGVSPELRISAASRVHDVRSHCPVSPARGAPRA